MFLPSQWPPPSTAEWNGYQWFVSQLQQNKRLHALNGNGCFTDLCYGYRRIYPTNSTPPPRQQHPSPRQKRLALQQAREALLQPLVAHQQFLCFYRDLLKFQLKEHLQERKWWRGRGVHGAPPCFHLPAPVVGIWAGNAYLGLFVSECGMRNLVFDPHVSSLLTTPLCADSHSLAEATKWRCKLTTHAMVIFVW